MDEGNSHPADAPDELTILQRIAVDDKKAVAECLEKYGKLIWSIARKLTATKADAEDAVQEIFIAIWRNAARFDPAKSPEAAFIALIAHRRLIDRLRNENRRVRTSSFESLPERHAATADSKLDVYLKAKPAVEALNKLKIYQKQLIVMAIYDGMTHGEIAKAVGLPLGTVKTNIRRGLKKIRSSIESGNILPIQN